MPITPFHFGPGAAIHALAPKRVSFLAFCGANVLMDVEPLYYMITHQFPLHRFVHTFVGATLVALLASALFWRRRPRVAVGATLGAYTHIVFDSVMHSDMRPFAPFGDWNPLYQLVSLSALHWFCVGAGVVGVGILVFRGISAENR